MSTFVTMLSGLMGGYGARGAALGTRGGQTQGLTGGAVLGHPLTKLVAGLVIVMALLAIGYRFGTGLSLGGPGSTVSASDTEECARRGCDVHLTATLVTRRYAEQLGVWQDIQPRLTTAQPFILTANAHVGTIRDLAIDGKVFLRHDGVTYPAADRPLEISTHHNAYLVFFPNQDHHGHPIFGEQAGGFEVLVKDLGDGWPEHTIPFPSSVPATEHYRPGLPQMLMVIGAAMAAMLLTCTPCLVGSLAVGSLTTGTTAGFNKATAREVLRSAMVRTTLSYLGALVVAYLAVAIVVYTFGLDIADLRPIELLGGLALFGIGVALLRSTPPGAWAEAALVRMMLRIAPGFRAYVSDEQAALAFGRGGSTAMGASLAMVCSVAGAPTLSTATLLPLLVYAGLSSPVWAFLIMLAYLVVCAVPFFLVAVGLGEFLLNASLRLRGTLLTANAALLMTLGLVLVVSPGTVAGAVAAPVRIMLLPLGWLL